MKVTCIIPTIGRSDFLLEAVNSVIQQKGIEIEEIIIINNGNAVNPHKFSDGRIKVYNIVPFAGVSQARNFGAALASNELLTFLDDDDLWPEEYLTKIFDNWSNDIDLCITRLDKLVNGNIMPYKKITTGDLSLDSIFIRNPGVTGSNIFVKKSVFFKVGGFDVRLKTSEDKDFLINIIDGGFNIKILSDTPVYHRSHDRERLTNYDSILIGMVDFYRKYHNRFSFVMKISYLKKFSKIKIKKIIQAM